MKSISSLGGILLGTILFAAGAVGSSAAAPVRPAELGIAADGLRIDSEVRGRARGGVARRTYVGPRGAATRRTVVGPRGNIATRNTAIVRPGFHGAGTRWVRPAGYWWRPGGAIAAGTAIGFVTAATAAAWAGAAPGPNMCWYYTDSTRTQGFWDACP